MLIFLDLETTGLESSDKILSIGIISESLELYELLNEGKKIPSLASSINHITAEMIKGKLKFKESESYKFLLENNNEDSILVGHNVAFDIKKLNEAGFRWRGGVIDTLRITKHLIPECEFFSLQFLRYELKLYRNEPKDITPHHALSDSKVVKLLFKYLKEISSVDEMLELTFKNVLIQKFEFGKHKGKYIEEVCMNDRGYIEWMLSNLTDLDEDLRYSLHNYLDT